MGSGPPAPESRQPLDSVHVRVTLSSQGQQGRQLVKFSQHKLFNCPSRDGGHHPLVVTGIYNNKLALGGGGSCRQKSLQSSFPFLAKSDIILPILEQAESV